MRIGRRWLAAGMVGNLALLGVVIYAQTNKVDRRMSKVTLLSAAHRIEVNLSPKCTKTKSEVGIPGDTVVWVPKAGQAISNWHIIFPESPFTNQQVYFDKDSKPVTIDLPDEDGVDFKYVIAVDGGAPCDPHVIVVKGTGDQAQ